MNKVLTILSIIVLFFLQQATAQDAIVAGKNMAVTQTGSGMVKGYIHNGTFTFKGIPYARAERFMPPVKADSWTGVRSSMAYGPVCPVDVPAKVNDENEFPFQHDWGYQNENCQSLNIWSKGLTDPKKRPVMVWIHGGGYMFGSSHALPAYDGENLARKGDVVVVSLNHRLNVLGFLDLSAYGDKYKSSANAGIMDLVAALQWVKANIANFGGDPNNVTIFGQSGGGGKITCLMSAPSARGLFQKAVIESGSFLGNFMEPALSKRISAALLEELHLQPSQVDSLQKIPYPLLSDATRKAMTKIQNALKAEGKPVAYFGLGPTLDGVFLPYQSNETAALELSKDIPLLVGTTKNELIDYVPGSEDWDMNEAKEFLKKRYSENTEEYMAAVKTAYPNLAKPSDYTQIDFALRQAAITQANGKAAVSGSAPVYMYVFAWQSPVNDGMYKARHNMEIPFVFNNINRCEEMTGGGKGAYELSDKVSLAWINFARTGNPNHNGLPVWPKYTAENGATMIFDTKCEVKNHHDAAVLKMAAAATTVSSPVSTKTTPF